jgi:hypothetical protein
VKGLKLKRLPYLLALQLKRFDYDFATFLRIKVGWRSVLCFVLWCCVLWISHPLTPPSPPQPPHKKQSKTTKTAQQRSPLPPHPRPQPLHVRCRRRRRIFLLLLRSPTNHGRRRGRGGQGGRAAGPGLDRSDGRAGGGAAGRGGGGGEKRERLLICFIDLGWALVVFWMFMSQPFAHTHRIAGAEPLAGGAELQGL